MVYTCCDDEGCVAIIILDMRCISCVAGLITSRPAVRVVVSASMSHTHMTHHMVAGYVLLGMRCYVVP